MIDYEVELGHLQVYLSSDGDSTDFSWYENSKNLEFEVSRQPDIIIDSSGKESTKHSIIANPISKLDYQTYIPMRGVGTSLDGAAVFHLKAMSEKHRKNFLTTLIDPKNGAGFTQFRLVIGTCDFNYSVGGLYSYYDKVPTLEPNWDEDFSIQKDLDIGVIDIIKEIQEIASEFGILDEITFLSSPWSPPGWMKENIPEKPTNNELGLIGGNLKEEHVYNWAIYLKRYIEEYAKLDIPIHAITLQNEPVQKNGTYPNCLHTGKQQGKIAQILKKELENSTIINEKGYSTEFWAWDFVPSRISALDNFLKDIESVDPGLASFDGITFHTYDIDFIHIGEIKKRYPKLSMHISESMEPGVYGATRIIKMFRVNCESYFHWVTLLDSNRKPNEWGNSSDPGKWNYRTLAVNNNNEYWFWPTKNILAQISRFIRPGHMKIAEGNMLIPGFDHMAYQDTVNRNFIIVAANTNNKAVSFNIRTPSGQVFTVTIPSHTIGTYIYSINN